MWHCDNCQKDHSHGMQHCPKSPNAPQPPSVANDHPACWDLFFRDFAVGDKVAEDIRERDDIGAKKYGVRLQPFNGRDPLVDLYQELLDAIVYAVQVRYERMERDGVEGNTRGRIVQLATLASQVRADIAIAEMNNVVVTTTEP